MIIFCYFPLSLPLFLSLGIAVTFAILPDAVAFAAVARVPTIVGLYGALFMCLIGMRLLITSVAADLFASFPLRRTTRHDFRRDWCSGRCAKGTDERGIAIHVLIPEEVSHSEQWQFGNTIRYNGCDWNSSDHIRLLSICSLTSIGVRFDNERIC
jgi:hypothetical protein